MEPDYNLDEGLVDNLADKAQQASDEYRSQVIAEELAAREAIFGLLNVLSGGTGGMAAAAAQRTSGGFANFLLSGFTGQTPKVNNTINISGGLVSSSYVRNTLVPAINKSRSFG